ncbi:MAG: tetratricopeptide repeat protein [Fibrobacteres bacterium]|nr:tetratricopeptide repeat protein [Fibrobacterota bacterium]
MSENKPYISTDPSGDDSAKAIDAEIVKVREHLKKDSSNADLFFKLGTLCLKRERHADAIEAFEDCIRIRPEYPEVNYLLGNSYISHKQFEIAARYFMKSLRSNPNHKPSLYNIGLCYVETGMKDKAIQAFRKFHAIEESIAWKEEARFQLYRLGVNP